ncbi:MAG: hypothetical protein ACI94Y_000259 [Maribacter sp.]|jgi:hypothetical protein
MFKIHQIKYLYLFIICVLASCTTENANEATPKVIVNEEFNKFLQQFLDMELPLEIKNDKGKYLGTITYEEAIQYLAVKWLDKENNMPNASISPLGKYMINDNTYALIYRSLELPVGSGNHISYFIATFGSDGKMIDKTAIAEFASWDGGSIKQTSIIKADQSIQSSYKMEDEIEKVSKLSEITISQNAGKFTVEEKVLENNTPKASTINMEVKKLDKYGYPDIIKKDFSGQFAQGITWQDGIGENFVIVTTKEKNHPSTEEAIDYNLYVRHYVFQGQKFPKVLWKTQDFVEECMFDNMLKLVDGSIAVTDLDNDNVAEITYMYTLGCISDVSLFPLKLIMHEDGKKMVIRGDVILAIAKDDFPEKITVDEKSFEGQPEEFKSFAIDHWKKHEVFEF